MPKRPPKTAAELMEELGADPAHQRQRAEREAAQAERSRRIAADEAPLIADLARAGVQVESIYDFVNRIRTPESAVPVLLAHLRVPHLAVIREGLLRALSYRHLRASVQETLERIFVDLVDQHERWLTANALAVMAEYAELARRLPGIDDYEELFVRSEAPQRRIPRES